MELEDLTWLSWGFQIQLLAACSPWLPKTARPPTPSQSQGSMRTRAACCLGGEKVEGLVDSSVPRGGRGTHTAHTPVSLLAAPCLFSTGCKAQGYGVSERLSCGLG